MASNTVTNMSKTILCRSVTGGGGRCMGGFCRYAHNIEELYPRLCKYGSKCNRHKDRPATCLFVHPDEDIFDYATTHGFISQPGPRPPPVARGVKTGRFENRVQHTDPARKQLVDEFNLSNENFPSLDVDPITPPSSLCDFDLEIGSPLTMSDLEMGNLSELDNSLHEYKETSQRAVSNKPAWMVAAGDNTSFNNDWPLPLVFSSNPSPLQRQTSAM